MSSRGIEWKDKVKAESSEKGESVKILRCMTGSRKRKGRLKEGTKLEGRVGRSYLV